MRRRLIRIRGPRLAAFLGAAALLATSCAAPNNLGPAAAPGNGGASSAPAGPKTLNLAVDVSAEPSTGMILIGRGGARGGGDPPPVPPRPPPSQHAWQP